MTDFIKNTSYIPLTELEKTNLGFKGLYSLRILNRDVLPALFKGELIENDTDVIYIGKGERTLLERLEEDCRGKSHATFFRGIGVLLGFRPPKGSLIGKKNQKNYKFSAEDSEKIVRWMNDNLEFNFIRLDHNVVGTEVELIKKYGPILNTTHNPNKSKLLAQLRQECRIMATTEI